MLVKRDSGTPAHREHLERDRVRGPEPLAGGPRHPLKELGRVVGVDAFVVLVEPGERSVAATAALVAARDEVGLP